MSEFNIQQLKVDSPITKVKDLVPIIQDRILNGEIDAAKTGVILKKFAKLYEELFKGDAGETVKDVIYEETIRYKEGKKATFELMGAKITDGVVRTWYDYEQCGDPLWNELNRLENVLKKLKKEREEELKVTMPTDSQLELGIGNKSILVPYELKIQKRNIEPNKVVQIIPPVKRQTYGLKYSV